MRLVYQFRQNPDKIINTFYDRLFKNLPQFEIDYADGAVFNNLIQKAIEQQDAMNFVQLITWNDIGEGTMIEPTIERQFDPLVALAPLTNGSTNVALYQLILDLHTLRKSDGDSTEIQNLKNQIDTMLNA